VCFLLLLAGDDLFPTLEQGVLLGRTDSEVSTFTGRLPLWVECLDYAAKRPLQGYGYGSFFSPSRVAAISSTEGWGIPDAHSTYLGTILALGLVGLIFLVLVLIVGIYRAIEKHKVSADPFYTCFAAILVYFALEGVLESTIALDKAGFPLFLFMVVIAKLGFTRCFGNTNIDQQQTCCGSVPVEKHRPRRE
jgi:O-antigen ligase